MEGVSLEVGVAQLRLWLPGAPVPFAVALPETLLKAQRGGAKVSDPAAKFSKKRQQLTITWKGLCLHEASPAEAPAPASDGTAAPTQCASERAANQASTAEEETAPAAATKEVATAPTQRPAEPATARAPTEEQEADSKSAAPVDGELSLGWRELENTAAEDQPAEKVQVDCLEVIEEELELALKTCTLRNLRNLRELNGCSILLDDFEVQGEATASEGQLSYNVSVDLSWDVMDGLGGMLGLSGSAQIRGLSEATTEPQVTVRATRGDSYRNRDHKRWILEQLPARLAACASSEAFREAVTAAAEERVREQVEAHSKRTAPPAPSAHCRERSLTEWAKACLQKRLACVKVRLFGGAADATIALRTVEGEAELRLVEGRPARSFALAAACGWSLSRAGAEVATGTLTLSQFNAESGAKKADIAVELDEGKKCSGQLLTALRKDGVAAVRSELEEFLAALERQA